MASLTCSRCSSAIPSAHLNTRTLQECASCGEQIRADVFPAMFRQIAKGSSGETAQDGESGCYFHPQKKAVVACESCGRFLCAVCDLEVNQRRMCPTCLENAVSSGVLNRLLHRRTLYDSTALVLAVLPLFIVWFVTFLTAPVAIYVAVRYWNAPTSIVPRYRGLRQTLAVLIAGGQLVLWFALLAYIIVALMGLV